jgi:hypothetical protein
MKKRPNKRAVYGLVAFFLIGGLAFLAAAAYSWVDEHGGSAGTARVTHCESSHINRQSSVHCDATWTYNGRAVTGYVENAKANQEGKTISVRIHGTSHVTNTTYWVPIGLALFGLFTGGMGVWILVSYRRRAQPTEA